MADNSNPNATIVGIKNKDVADQLGYKDHAEEGAHFLTTAAESPTGDYYGFQVSDSGVTVTDINFGKYANLYSGTAVDFIFAANQVYLIKFESITISAGELMLFKR